MNTMTHDQRLKRSHITLLRSKPYAQLAGILMLGKTELRDDIPTAMTDGINKFYSPKFMDTLSDKQLNWVVAHENFHVMLKQLTVWRKLFDRDADTANRAADYVINQMIADLDPARQIVIEPESILLDEQYRGWDTNRVFDHLFNKKQEQGQDQGEDSGATLDSHNWEDAKALTPAEQESISDAIDQAIRQGEILAGKIGGTSPRDIGALPDPAVRWEEQLRDFVTSTMSGRDSATWRRPSRRWLGQDIYRPSPYSEALGPIVIGVDTSGSIDQQTIAKFLAEIVAITETVNPERLHLLYWDTDIRQEETYEQGSYPLLATSTKPAGGGGTDALCVERYVRDMPTPPELVLMLSDGYLYAGWPEFGVPTLWAMTTNKTAPNAVNIRINL